MARTLNGKCTGTAARIEKRQLREEIASANDAAWLAEYNRTAQELMAIDPDCETWFFARPEQTRGEMYPLMVERLEELQRETDAKDLRDTQRSIISEMYPA